MPHPYPIPQAQGNLLKTLFVLLLFAHFTHEFMTIVNTISLSLSLTLANEETFENTLSDMYLENYLYNAETNQNNGFIAEKDVNWTPHVAPQIGKKSWET